MGLIGEVVWGLRREIAGYEREAWEAVDVRSSAELRRWRRIGAVSPPHVAGWRWIAPDVAEAEAWNARGLAPSEVAAWKRVAEGLAEVDTWLLLGIREPAEASRWKQSCDNITEVVMWLRLSVQPSAVSHWRNRGVRPEDRRDWLRLGVEGVSAVADWTSRGFAPVAARPWILAGLRPEDAQAWAECDFSERSSRRWRKREIPPTEAQTFRAVGCRPSGARRWMSAGLTANSAASWISGKVARREALRWEDLGVRNPDDAAAWVEAVGSRAQVEAWMRAAGVLSESQAAPRPAASFNAADAARWIQACFTANDLASWRLITTDAEAAAQWRDAVGGPEEATRWQAEGLDDPCQVSELVMVGVMPEEWAAWRSLGATTAVDLLEQRQRWDVDTCRAWLEETGLPLPDAAAWYRLARGHAGVVRQWAALGITSAGEAESWTDRGLDAGVARDWIDAGLADPSAAAAWTEEGIPAETAAGWVALQVTDPVDVKALIEASVDPQDFVAWRDLGACEAGEVLEWAASWTLVEARRWANVFGSLQRGFAWHQLTGAAIDVAQRWHGLGVDDVHEAKALLEASARRDLTAAAAVYELFREHDVLPSTAAEWLRALPLEAAVAWVGWRTILGVNASRA